MGEGCIDRPSPDLQRVTVAQAADALGVSPDAVRKRIARDTIGHGRDERGRVYVNLTPSETVHKTGQYDRQDDAAKTVQDAYVRSLEDQISFLRQELERKGNEAERLLGIVAGLVLANAEQAGTLRAIQAPEPEEVAEGAETVEEAPEPRPAPPSPQLAPQRPRSGGLRGLRRRILGW